MASMTSISQIRPDLDKRSTNLVHARWRAFERHGIDLSDAEMDALHQKIKGHSPDVVPLHRDRFYANRVWVAVKIQLPSDSIPTWLPIVFDEATDSIVTFPPPNSIDRYRRFLEAKDQAEAPALSPMLSPALSPMLSPALSAAATAILANNPGLHPLRTQRTSFQRDIERLRHQANDLRWTGKPTPRYPTEADVKAERQRRLGHIEAIGEQFRAVDEAIRWLERDQTAGRPAS